MSAVGSTIRTRISEIDSELAEIADKEEPLKRERKALEGSLKNIEKALNGSAASSSNGGGASAPAKVDNDALLGALRSLGKPAKAQDVAKQLGVDTRNVARKLRKLVDDGLATGDKDAGYQPK